MNRKYFKQNKIDKEKEFLKIIDSIIIEDRNYRDIFDDAVQFEYGKPLTEYYEKHIDRIMVNNIRHHYSNYDQVTKQMHKIHRYNGESDYIQYKNSVLDKIANTYPLLEEECNKQKRRFNMVNLITEVG